MGKKELGKRIRRAIKDNNKTQKDFAGSLGTAQPVLSRWITGKRAPSYEYLVKIAHLTGVSLDWLMLGEGYKKKQSIKIAAGDDARSDAETVNSLRVALKFWSVINENRGLEVLNKLLLAIPNEKRDSVIKNVLDVTVDTIIIELTGNTQ